MIEMLENVRQVTIQSPIMQLTASGMWAYTGEYDSYRQLPEWGFDLPYRSHGRGEYARDDDENGFHEVHVNTAARFWSPLCAWLRPHRGISREKLPLYLGFFQCVHNVRIRGKGLLRPLLEPPDYPQFGNLLIFHSYQNLVFKGKTWSYQ